MLTKAKMLAKGDRMYLDIELKFQDIQIYKRHYYLFF